MNRRQFNRTALKVGAVAVAAPTVLALKGCPGAKNLSVWVNTVVGALQEIAPLLPSSARLISKAVKIAQDFDVAYWAGKFLDATALFENLAGVLSQITQDAGINNPTIKIALAVAGVAMRAIAVLLKSQSNQPQVAAVLAAPQTPEMRRRANLIESLANPTSIDALYASVKP